MAGGRGFFSGNVTAAAHLTPSDVRLKADLRPIDNAVAGLAHIRGLSYRYRGDADTPGKGTHPRRLGVAAQDVESVYPELVSTNADGYKSVDYQGLVPVLIEAVKEQQQTMDVQQKKLDEQRQRIEALLQATTVLSERLDGLEKNLR